MVNLEISALLAPPQVMEEQGTEADKDFRFFISVAGKRGLRRLRWRKACSTKPDPLAKCEFYMFIAGVLYDAGCKHCFRPEMPLEGDGAAQASEAEDESSSSTSSDSAESSSSRVLRVVGDLRLRSLENASAKKVSFLFGR